MGVSPLTVLPRKKMFRPSLHAGVEERNQLAGSRINPGKVASPMEVAMTAGEGEIAEVVFPPVLSRQHVVNVKSRERRMLLQKPTILASVSGARTNLRSDRLTDHALRRLLVADRALACSTAMKSIART